MKKLAIPVFALFLALPANAQSGKDTMTDGVDLLQKGTELLLEGLLKEFAPALKDLNKKIIDLNAYHAPEILPNGDIIIRRKTPVDAPQDGEVDL